VKGERVGKIVMSKSASLKERLNEIDLAVMGEIYEPFTASRLRILVGMWEKGEAIVRFIGGVKTGWTYHSMMTETGRDEKALKKWHGLYEKYQDKEEYIEEYARPRAEAWANKALGGGTIPKVLPPPAFPLGAYPVLYADPPWRYDFAETDNRAIENQYPTMELEDIIALSSREDWPDTGENAVLFLWATAPKMQEALAVMSGWGFTYKTQAVWDKEIIGMGYWFRGQHEVLLVGTKGKFPPPDPSVRIASVIKEKREGHSAKPKCFYQIIEDMAPLPDGIEYLELFSRGVDRPRWVGWGNQA